MFKTQRTHQQFQQFVKKEINEYFNNQNLYYLILNNADIIFKVCITDLTFLKKLLLPTYHPHGEIPWDPVCMFRSYWLMCQHGDSASITPWVKTLQSEPFWAILSGFKPKDVPGIGTFYDFEKRLCDFDKGQRVERINKMHKPKSKPQKKLKKNEKKPPKHKGIVNKLVKRIMRDEAKSQPVRADDTLHTIFKNCFVLPSAQKGLLGNLDNLSISGDGIIFDTGASPYGIKECDCWEKHGVLTCSCPRRFNDPDANWGWDSYREKYVYGYSSYTFTAADSPHDLPIFSTLAQASRHDSVTHTYSLYRMKILYPEFNIKSDILDSAHDNYPTYELLNHWNIEPFIDLNQRNLGNIQYPECEIEINENGVPICKCGHKMTYWGPDHKRRRHKWRCPHVVLKSVNCPYFNRPEDDYGRTKYTKFDDDLRLFTPTVRGSKKWKETMNKRTSSERRNSQIKYHYDLENDRVRSKSRWLIRIIMRDAAIHANAWIKTSNINPEDWVKSWFGKKQVA